MDKITIEQFAALKPDVELLDQFVAAYKRHAAFEGADPSDWLTERTEGDWYAEHGIWYATDDKEG